MARVTVEGQELRIGLSALEKLAAFRGDVRVPLSAVRSVRIEAHPWTMLRGLRAPGTGLPGVIAYGVRRATGDRPDFAALLGRRVSRRGAVVIELDPPSPFARLVVSVDDPEGTVAAVRAAAGS